MAIGSVLFKWQINRVVQWKHQKIALNRTMWWDRFADGQLGKGRGREEDRKRSADRYISRRFPFATYIKRKQQNI